MIKAIVFDLYGVLYVNHGIDKALLDYIKTELRPKYKIGLLSNIETGALRSYFKTINQTKLFDAIVLSGDIGFAKPHAGAYTHICQQLGVEPGEAIMVDDLPSNIDGARAMGMYGVCFFNLAQTTREINDLLTT